MKKIVSTLVLMTLCLSMAVIAQTRSVTGSVTDSKGGPIPFAAVIIKGTKQGVTTDADGRFVIKAKTGDVLEVVAQGMLKKEV
ncbi:carboxypeptidase-like regulatory domain-containing protein, partial [Salmonella enterica]|uniref:carboxypeptidase-like regulatory domain-containing protein n=1 Tax=Salmonella enterica TaxID=28901 RepID=UPI0032B336B1